MWAFVLKELGYITIIAGFVTWLIKQLGQNLINKDLKVYEHELKSKSELFKQELNLSYEKYKHELSILESKVTKLHDKRIERIEMIYSLLTDFYNDMIDLVSMKIVTGRSTEEIEKQEKDDVNKAAQSGNAFLDYYTKNKMYFNNTTSDLIERIIKLLKESHSEFSMKYYFGTLPAKEHYAKIKIAIEKIKDEVPKIKTELEQNFKTILGVE